MNSMQACLFSMWMHLRSCKHAIFTLKHAIFALCSGQMNISVCAGVCNVIKACRSLTVLHLLRCSGPFGDALGGAFQSRRPLLLLRELHIVDGAQDLTDGGLACCLARF